jgi:hypothetical protein
LRNTVPEYYSPGARALPAGPLRAVLWWVLGIVALQLLVAGVLPATVTAARLGGLTMTLVPLLVLVLQPATTVSEALDARGADDVTPPPRGRRAARASRAAEVPRGR